jgi:Na+:H+ antiporter, NhaA family
MGTSLPQIDLRPVRRLTAPFVRFTRLESAGSIVLLFAAAAAMLLANSRFAPAYNAFLNYSIGGSADTHAFRWTLHEWINDGLMTVFFLSVGLEVKRELLIGELASPRRALLPILAACGGVLVPALLYSAFNWGRPTAAGWGVPIATDIAFSLAVLALFGSRIPLGLKVFLVTLAIADDIAGVAVIATVYSHPLHLGYLALAAGIFALCLVFNQLGVKGFSVYLATGLALWWAVYLSGVHATVAGVLLALAVPSRSFLPHSAFLDRGRLRLEEFASLAERAGPRSHEARRQLHMLREGTELSESPLDRMQARLHPWVSFAIMPLFAFANAGIALGSIHGSLTTDSVFWGVFLGLALGKPLGITLFSWIAVRLRLAELPPLVTWSQLHAASWLGGIGFTISIFIAGLAFQSSEHYTLARIAILLASCCAAAIGACLIAITRGPFRTPSGRMQAHLRSGSAGQ